MPKLSLLFVSLVMTMSCQMQNRDTSLLGETVASEPLSPAKAYLLEVLDIAEDSALNREQVDWSALKAEVFETLVSPK